MDTRGYYYDDLDAGDAWIAWQAQQLAARYPELGPRELQGLAAETDWAEVLNDERQAARGELAGAPERMECYKCAGFDGVHFVMQDVVALGPVAEARRDPTQTYRLSCGHLAI